MPGARPGMTQSELTALVIQEASQLPAAARMLQLPERLGLDLAYALAGNRELLADFFQRVVGVHADAEAHAQDALLARGQRGQNPRRRLAQIGLDRGVQWQDRVLVLDEIAEVGIRPVADRRFEAARLLRDLQYLAHLFQRHRQFLGELLGSRLAADLVQHLARGAHQLVDRLDHVHRDADRARLVGNRAGDRLTDPPCRIGREFIAAAIFEFIDRFHQADIAFLDQIEELQAAVGVFLGDRDDEPEVGLDHLLFRAAGFALAALDRLHDAAELGNRQLRLAGDLGDRRAVTRDIVDMLVDELRPAAAGQLAGSLQPVARQFVAHVMLHEIGALDAGSLGKPQQPALFGDKPAVQFVELLDEVLDTGVVELDLAEGLDDLVLQLVVAALGGARQLGGLDDRGDTLVLDLGKLFVALGDAIEDRHHAGPQLRFHRGERGSGFLAVFLAVAFALFAELDDDSEEDGEEARSEEHTSELQSHSDLVCRLLLEKKKKKRAITN